MVTSHYATSPALPSVLTEGEMFQLVPGVLNLAAARGESRLFLARTLSIPLLEITAEELPDPWRGTGFTVTLAAGSRYGYHRITYDTARRWTLCSDPSKPVMSPNCAFPLPTAPPREVLSRACEHIVFIHHRRTHPVKTAAGAAGINPDGFAAAATAAPAAQPA
jgi:hypothetical protein